MENQYTQIMMLRRRLRSKLAPQRYEHTLSVSFTCMNLAMRYGYDMGKAELAGLLHDCGNVFPMNYSEKVPKAQDSRDGRGVQDPSGASRQVRRLAGRV